MTWENQECSSESLYDSDQAARYLNCSKRFLEIKRLKGGGPKFVRLSPKAIRYRKSDLDSWIAERIRKSTSEYGGGAA